MSDEINIEFVEQSPIEIQFEQQTFDIELVENQSVEIEFVEANEINIDLVEPAPIEIEFPIVAVNGVGVPPGGTTGQVLAKETDDNYDTEWIEAPGGAVDSVNGETGVVVLDHTDVGADALGSAAQALSDANDYTDTQIATLTFVETIVAGTGVTVDDTDPQNPIISATALPQQIYFLQDQETTSTFAYVGYEATEGDWYIYRRTRANNLREYAFGASNYSTNWTNRAALVYS